MQGADLAAHARQCVFAQFLFVRWRDNIYAKPRIFLFTQPLY